MTMCPKNVTHQNSSSTHRGAWLSLMASGCLFVSAMSGCGDSSRSVSRDDSSGSVSATESHFAEPPALAQRIADSAPAPAETTKTFKTDSPTAGKATPSDKIRETAAPASESRCSEEVAAATESEMPADESFAPDNGRQSGVLTAGSFDDVANFGDYLSFLRRHQRQANQCQLPLNVRTHQTVISLKDSEGKPLGNVRCVVRQPGSNQVLLNKATGTDGRVMLLTDRSLNHPQQPAELQLQVFVDAQQQATIDEVRHIGRKWNVTVGNAQAQLPRQLDVALVVDTTGSMGDELEYLKTEIDSIVASVNRMFPDVDQRYSLVTYRDNGDQYVCRNFDFTGSLSDFRRNLDAQSASGGGDFPEAMDVALNAAGDLSWRDGNTAKVLFLVGDAPPHQENLSKAMKAVQHLGDQGVRVFPVGASGVEATAEVVMRTASLLTMGQYLFLTDHSGVGNAHATPDVPEFAVERLDRLMIRMIASELAGKRLVADEVIAIERGERYSYVSPVCTPIVGRPQRSATSRPVNRTPPTVAYCSVVSPQADSFSAVMRWIAKHVLATIVALIAGIFVFDQLTKHGSA